MLLSKVKSIILCFLITFATNTHGMNSDEPAYCKHIIQSKLINSDTYKIKDGMTNDEKKEINQAIDRLNKDLKHYEEDFTLCQVMPFFEEITKPEKIQESILEDMEKYLNHIENVFELFSEIPEEERNLDKFILKYKEVSQSLNGSQSSIYRNIIKSLKSIYIKDERKERIAELKKEYERIIKIEPLQYNKEDILNHMSVNLMWCNNKLQPNNKFIFPSPWIRGDIEIDLFSRILGWAKHYKIVDVLYDSKYVSEEQLKSTQDEIERQIENHPDINSKIYFKDIRSLEVIKNKNLFTGESRLYLIVDYSRVASSYETLTKSPLGTFFLYSDFSLDPETCSPDKLLDEATVRNLNDYAIVQGSSGSHYENSFHIWGNHNKYLLEAIKYVLIDLSIKSHYSNSNDTAVYAYYPLMFSLFYDLSGLATAQLEDNKSWRDIPKDMLAGYLSNHYSTKPSIPPTTMLDSKLKYLQHTSTDYPYMPLSPILVPVSHLG